jgi:hypothetical protein
MFDVGVYIELKDKDLDLLLLNFVTQYGDYRFCEALLLFILCTEMGET